MDEAGIDRAFLISYMPVQVIAHDTPEKREHMLGGQHYLTKDSFVRMWRQHPDRVSRLADSIDPRVPGLRVSVVDRRHLVSPARRKESARVHRCD